MRSWTNTYFTGAVWGTSLIVAAIVAFVPLVSLQTPHEWPISPLGVGSDASSTGRKGAIASEDKPAARNLDVVPNAGPSVAASRATDTPTGSAGGSGKRRHDTGARGGGTGSLVNEAPAVSPASAEGPVAPHPGSHPPAGAGATLAAPAAGPPETGGGSDPTVEAENAGPDGAGKTPGSLPTTTTAVIQSPDSGPPLADESFAASASTPDSSAEGGRPSSSEAKGQSGQSHGTSRTASPPPVSAAAVPRRPGPGPPGAGAGNGHD